MLATLVDRGFVYARRGLVHRRPSDGALLFEAQVAGRCPRCEAAASANDCENCGRFHDDGETVDGRCARSGEALELVSLDRYYLRLEA
ncbi:class I tRNA ligase family protein, partial [Acinetobacter baumannii]